MQSILESSGSKMAFCVAVTTSLQSVAEGSGSKMAFSVVTTSLQSVLEFCSKMAFCVVTTSLQFVSESSIARLRRVVRLWLSVLFEQCHHSWFSDSSFARWHSVLL